MANVVGYYAQCESVSPVVEPRLGATATGWQLEVWDIAKVGSHEQPCTPRSAVQGAGREQGSAQGERSQASVPGIQPKKSTTKIEKCHSDKRSE